MDSPVDSPAAINTFGGDSLAASALSSSSSPGISTGGIAGAAIGGLVLLVLLAMGGFLFARKRQQARGDGAAELDPLGAQYGMEHKGSNVTLLELGEDCSRVELASPPAEAAAGVAAPRAELS